MRKPKALLPAPGGRTFLARIVRTLAEARVEEIVVVAGELHETFTAALEVDNPPVAARVVVNPDPSRGQLSSLWIGMAEVVRPDTEAIIVTLVDVPMVEPETIVQVVDTWRRSRAPIVRPAIGDRHGHPVIFDRAVFDELRRAPLDEGAKRVVRDHAAEVIDVPVRDEGCLVDIDTPADYEVLRRRE